MIDQNDRAREQNANYHPSPFNTLLHKASNKVAKDICLLNVAQRGLCIVSDHSLVFVLFNTENCGCSSRARWETFLKPALAYKYQRYCNFIFILCCVDGFIKTWWRRAWEQSRIYSYCGASANLFCTNFQD